VLSNDTTLMQIQSGRTVPLNVVLSYELNVPHLIGNIHTFYYLCYNLDDEATLNFTMSANEGIKKLLLQILGYFKSPKLQGKIIGTSF
jgi:hypothetical protein